MVKLLATQYYQSVCPLMLASYLSLNMGRPFVPQYGQAICCSLWPRSGNNPLKLWSDCLSLNLAKLFPSIVPEYGQAIVTLYGKTICSSIISVNVVKSLITQYGQAVCHSFNLSMFVPQYWQAVYLNMGIRRLFVSQYQGHSKIPCQIF